MMNIKVYRGANQIGGCITEISTNGCKILIDFGSNLPGNETGELSDEQIQVITAGADAVFYTHYHGDHVGLFDRIPRDSHGKSIVPQYIGKGARDVLICKCKALHKDENVKLAEQMLPYYANTPIDVLGKGKIKVTPYFVSHSAFDSYMLRIECDGKVILHTGDFRRHGYIGGKLMEMLNVYIGQVDILIIEGTMLGRKGEMVLKESDIEHNTVDFLRGHKYVFALCSSTDMERLASFYNACNITGRKFIVDKYQGEVLDIFTHYSGSKSNLFNFEGRNRFNVPNRGFFSTKVTSCLKQYGFLMLLRKSSIEFLRQMLSVYNEEDPWLIYSMWRGYAETGKTYSDQKIHEIRSIFYDRIKDGTKDGFHTSGHADIETLIGVCATVKPRVGIIPIHKEETSHFEDLPGLQDFDFFTDGDYYKDNIHISVR